MISVFNCSNDMALAADVKQYVPPKMVRQMEEDLAGLARWWDDTRFAGPWGWSVAAKQRLKRMGVGIDELPGDEWLRDVRRLASREFACGYVREMLGAMDDVRLVGERMRFVGEGEFEDFVKGMCGGGVVTHGDEGRAEESVEEGEVVGGVDEGEVVESVDEGPWVFKSPWSSSGRGVFVAKRMDGKVVERLRGYVSAQGGFAVDRFYEEKLVDFAMEFFVGNEGDVEFLGYSVFHAGEGGAYGFNYVESQERLMERIGVDEKLLERLVEYHREHLGKTRYRGVVGVDMMKVMMNGEVRVHPCVEINMRMNMGVLALVLWEKLRGKLNGVVELTERRERGFQAVVDEGRLMIVYRK